MDDKIDVTKLQPAVLASHLGNPSGEIGLAVMATLKVANTGCYQAAFERLQVALGDRVLEVGFGNGDFIRDIISLADRVSYTGIDISETMVEAVSASCASEIASGRVTLRLASSSVMPFTSQSFDKALGLNTLYFWQDPRQDLRELRRVLRPGGKLVLFAVTPWSAAGRPVFAQNFNFYGERELGSLVRESGFTTSTIEVVNETITPPTGKPWNRDSFVVTAS
ncbi:MAG: methyltransferase domain-containing protein [Hyphomicrobiaceae bacterium]|nr:methyltransferase domain-containing protein [Hyphomicrobiaceae bacterium]